MSRASGVILFIMETTRRDYFNRLPEDIRAEAIKNVEKDVINFSFGYSADEVLGEKVDAKNALIGAFAWNVDNKMSQVQYWSDINDKYFSHE